MIVQTETLDTEQTLRELVLKPLRNRSGLSPIKFSAGEYLIGTAPHCECKLTHGGIAEEHCRLKFDGDNAFVQSIDSRTWINDGPVMEAHLRSGDRLSIGPVNFLIEFNEPAQSSTSSQNDLSLLSGNQVLQYLQRAVSHGQIDPAALQELNPEKTSSQSTPVENVLDELSQAIRQTREQRAEHQQELAQMASVSPQPCPETKTKPCEQIDLPLQSAAEDLGDDFVSVLSESAEANNTAANDIEANITQENLQTLQRQIEQLQEQLAQQEEAHCHHELLLSEKQKEIHELTANLDAREQDFSISEQELQDSLSAKMHAEKEWQAQEHEFLFQQADLDRQVKSLKEELASSNTQGEAQEEQQAQLEQQIQDAQQTLEEQEEQFRQEKTAWSELEQQLQVDVEKHQQREQEILSQQAGLEEQVQSLEQELTASNAQGESDQIAQSQLEQQLQDAQQTLQEQEEQFRQEKTVWSELEQQLSRDVEKHQQREQEILSQQADIEEQVQSLEQELTASNAQGESDQIAQSQLEQQLQDAQQTLEEQEEQFRQEKTAWSELEQQLQVDVQESQKQIPELSTLHEQAEKSRAAAVEELNCAREAYTQELTFAQEALVQEQSRIKSLEKDFDQLQRQAEQQDSEKSDQIAEQRREVDEQLLKIASEKEYIEAVREEVESEKEAFSQARKDLQEVREQVEQNQQQQFDDLEQEREELEQARKELLQSRIALLEEDKSEPEQETELSESYAEDHPLDLDLNLLKEISHPENSPMPTDAAGEEVAESETPSSSDSDGPRGAEQEVLDDVSDLRGELSRMFNLDASPTDAKSIETPRDDVPAVSETSGFSNEIPVDDTMNTEALHSQHSDDLEELEAEHSGTSAAPTVGQITTEVDDADDPDSIAVYMQNLFMRTSGSQEYSEPIIPQKSDQPEPSFESEQSLPISIDSQEATDSVETSEQSPLSPVDELPITSHTQVDREAMEMDIASLRDVANQTARNALSTHAWKQLRVKVLLNGILTVASGVASAVLLASPLLGDPSYRNYGVITLLLCSVTTIELFRANVMLMRLKTGESLDRDETSKSGNTWDQK